jgi:hypothetical protein
LECLKYAHENNCHLQIHGDKHISDTQVCARAAYRGSLECLQYAHTNGYGWDQLTCTNATISGSLECLRYACENGCECDLNECIARATGGRTIVCVQYLRQLIMAN